MNRDSRGLNIRDKRMVRRSILPWRLAIAALLAIAISAGVVRFADWKSQAARQILQDRLWEYIDERSIPGKDQREIIPNAYRTVRVSMDALKQLLARAPMEFTKEAKVSPVVMSLPMPDGTMAGFKVVESPMMESELAKRYPDTKTYSGHGLDDPTATMRFDVSLSGFHAIILSATETVYIDPYSKDDTEHYISYFKRDLIRKSDDLFRCLTEDLLAPARRVAPKALSYWGTLHSYRLAVAATYEYTNYFRFPGDTDEQAKDRAVAAVTTTVNRVNSIYGRDLAIRLVLINNERDIIYPNIDDPYTALPGTNTILDENQANVDGAIGSDNYDIGHVVGVGGNGLARMRSVCNAGEKAEGSNRDWEPGRRPF